MAPQGVNLLAGRELPDLHRFVLAAGGQPLAIGAEGHAFDVVSMALQGKKPLARGAVRGPSERASAPGNKEGGSGDQQSRRYQTTLDWSCHGIPPRRVSRSRCVPSAGLNLLGT